MSSEAKNKNNRGTDRSRKGNGALFGTLLTAALMATSLSPLSRSLVHAQQPSTAKPNILVIFGDDIGQIQHQRLHARRGGLQDAEHRPHRQ